ncbi:ethanolamine ammonia-lyase subunit EutC [Bacillus rubiinfantis]|uniref:ethanolamine ammonia-lyase subunit EutC n=1 Tax=Bacillus rubiinfantis TaxID=1499680 RepID=UPI0005A87664|nr:ethanolamine ammonia-lyase subunit EutC [Bacillus rubiinfantis]
MNPELIEKVTKLIVEKLQGQAASSSEKQSEVGIRFWNHAPGSAVNHQTSVPPLVECSQHLADDDSLIAFGGYGPKRSNVAPQKQGGDMKTSETALRKIHPAIGVDQPFDPEALQELMNKTPARIGIGRAGLRPKTDTWLKFRFDHAAAVDAVYGDVSDELLKRLDLFKVRTMVADKEVYIRRPDYGRKLSEEAKHSIREKCRDKPTVQIIISDGLSSSAVEENVEDVYLSLRQSLQTLGLDVGTPFYIEKGRVAVMDDVGELLQPKVIVLLIGERPGLVSAESLSAYLCYQPRKGTIEADRMVISNIHKGGIPPVEAGAYIGTVVQKILKYEASGVSLVQKEG